MKISFDSIMLFSDGACTGNPGPGGWGSIVVRPEGQVVELGGFDPQTTNNRMELTGSIRALGALESPATAPVEVFTDSTYVIRGITEWIWGWRRRGWKNAAGLDVANRDLWEELSKQVTRVGAGIQWRYVRGHMGVPGNERCDEIAVAFANRRPIELYDGPLRGYGIPIHDLPDDLSLPSPRNEAVSGKKEPVYSYLSFHGGKVMRHRTWAECERRVKGQSQAKFKKAKSAQDEREILKGWGLDPSRTEIG